MQFQKIDFIASAATGVTLEAKFPAAVFVNRKRIALVIMERTAPRFSSRARPALADAARTEAGISLLLRQ